MVQRVDDILVTWLNDRAFTCGIGVVAADPRKYGDHVVASTGLPAVSGGLTWPITYPITYSATVTSGIIHIDNPATFRRQC
jgi:hypothetical protein